jgi:hypothetical protein
MPFDKRTQANETPTFHPCLFWIPITTDCECKPITIELPANSNRDLSSHARLVANNGKHYSNEEPCFMTDATSSRYGCWWVVRSNRSFMSIYWSFRWTFALRIKKLFPSMNIVFYDQIVKHAIEQSMRRQAEKKVFFDSIWMRYLEVMEERAIRHVGFLWRTHSRLICFSLW